VHALPSICLKGPLKIFSGSKRSRIRKPYTIRKIQSGWGFSIIELDKTKQIFGFFTIIIISCLLIQQVSYARSDSLILKAQQHWDTYGEGATCIAGSHNLFLKNIDGDAHAEIITGGSSYRSNSDGSTTAREAPLRIWNWNGEDLMLKAKHNWPGNINCVFAADVDGDGQVELVTSGSIRNDSGVYSSLRVWSWDGGSLSLRASIEGVSTSAIFVSDLDGDGIPEIITVGRFSSAGQYGAKLNVYRLEETGLEVQASVQWCASDSNVTSVSSVFAHDLNNDGRVEIVTGGYAYDLKNSSGQLRVWHYDANVLTLRSSEEWRLVEGVYGLTIAGGVQGNTVVNHVKVGDLNGDGFAEIVTGGFAFDGENINAQLRIWSWNGESLLLEASEEWATDYLTEVKCVSLGDVDGDSNLEIVTSGGVGAAESFANNASVPNHAQLRVWDWDGSELTLKCSEEWTIGDGVFAWNVATSDLDGDGVVEIVTVGCMGMGVLCDPDMRVWALQSVDTEQVFLGIILAGIVVIVLVFAVLFFVLRKRR
jgi:hypothetical protein